MISMTRKSRWKYIRNIIIVLSITLICASISIGKNYKEVIETIRQANTYWILFMLVLMISYYLLDALIILTFGKAFKHDYRYVQAFRNTMSGVFLSDITPSSSGGQFAQIYVFNKQGINATNGSSIVLMCFITHQSVLVVYSMIALLFNLSYIINNTFLGLLILLGFISNLGFIAILFLGAKSKKVQNFLVYKVVKFLCHLRVIKNYEETSAKVINYLHDFRKQLDFLQHNKRVLMISCVCNVGKMTIIYCLPFLATQALWLGVSIHDLGKFVSYCSFIYLINAFLPIPGASGGSEVCYMLFYGFLGSVGASSSMTLWRFMSYYVGLFMSGMIFSFDKEINGPGINKVKIEDME